MLNDENFNLAEITGFVNYMLKKGRKNEDFYHLCRLHFVFRYLRTFASDACLHTTLNASPCQKQGG